MELEELLDEVRGALGTTELQLLARGGQKLVCKASLEDVPCVVKIVEIPQTAHADEVLERARREVELLSTVESDYVVRVLSEAVEVGGRPDYVCWIEEMLDGADVGALTSTFPWSEDEVWALLRDGARGLDACHELDVVHRDLSPGNVRRRSDGRYVLMDPGFARHLNRTAITGVYQPGTPGYCTPEHVPGGHPTTASDIFGLGILAFQALTTALPVPYVGDDAAYWEALRHEDAPRVKAVGADVPQDLADVVDRCLQRQAARRYLDAAELLEDLERRGQGAAR